MKILNNIARFYRKNKVAVNIGGIIIIGCLLVYGVLGFFTENTASPIYGNRLNGINEVKITKDKLKEVNETLEKDEKIKEAKVTVEGKMIQSVIKVEDDTNIEQAKKSSSQILSQFSKEELSFYDIEIYISKKDEAKNNFPIIGHKKAGKENISWTKDREVSE